MKISDYFLDTGKLLGLRMKRGSDSTVIYYRIKSWEQQNYRYTWAAAIAANSAGTGFSEIQNAQNTYILMPQQDNMLFHFFVGVWPSNQLLFLQYPSSKDRNALAISRPVDKTGQGAIDGKMSQVYNPAPETEIISMPDLRPVYQMFNNSDVSVTPQLWFYARAYIVEGPYLIGHPAVGDEKYVQNLVDQGQARIISMYGNDYINIPSRIESSIKAA